MTPLRHDDYRAAVAQALVDGWVFAGLHASQRGRVVRVLLAAPDGELRIESVQVVDGTVPTLVDLTGAANWDEREAADLYGITFSGHAPLRPLVDHDLDLSQWTVPVNGEGPYQVAVGPIHAGVIESGHFRFHLVGDRILLLDARLFYKHRGLERAAEGRSLDEALGHVERACAACSVSSPLAYAHACEEALGLEPTEELARTRTMLLELERLWSHLNDVAAVCAGVGLAAGTMRYAELTERARRVNARATGHRFLRGAVAIGRSRLDIDAQEAANLRREIHEIGVGAASAWRELAFNASFQDRLVGVGVVASDDALRLGAVGPSARASGVAEDVRCASPRLAYTGHEALVPEAASGDVRARLEQRMIELRQTLALLDALLGGPHLPSEAVAACRPRSIGAGRVEGARGATACVVELEHGVVSRVHLRTGSFANWPVVAFSAGGEMLPDFPLVNKSFELCYACADR